MKFLTENRTMLIITSIAILGLIAFMTYQFVTEKIRRKKILKEKLEFEKLCADTYKKIIDDINNLIVSNQQMLDNFVVSIGEYTMGQITSAAKNKLKEIEKSEMYKVVYSTDEAYKEFAFNFKLLQEENSNMWAKKCESSLNWFRSEPRMIEERENRILESSKKQSKFKKIKRAKVKKESNNEKSA